MPNIAAILKAEITRVARKEVRAEVLALRKASAQQRAALAQLRQQLVNLQRELKRLDKRVPAASGPPAQSSQENGPDRRRRFSASRLAAHRSKLGLSAAHYGQLVGLSGQTVYNWERGKTKPTPTQVQQLALLKALSPTVIRERLGKP